MKKGILLLLVIIPLTLSANFNIESKSLSNLIFNYETDSYNIYQENGFSHLYFDDFTTQQTPGKPELPYKEFCIGVPPNGDIEVIITSIETETVKLESKLSPVPRIVSSGKTNNYIYEIDQTLYNAQEKKFIQIMKRAKYRFNNIIPIRFYPVLYDQHTNEITICKNINFEIRIIGDVRYRNYIEEKNDVSASNLIVNYNYAKNWKERTETTFTKMPFENSDFWYKFKTDKIGWFEINYEDLQTLPDFCDPSQIRILTMAKKQVNSKTEFELVEVPIFTDAGDDGSFDVGDKIIFKREQVPYMETYYQNEMVFWLTFGGNFQGNPARLEKNPNILHYNSIFDFEQKIISNNLNNRTDIDGIIIYPGDISSSQTGVFETHAQDYADLHPEMNFIIKSQSAIFDSLSGGNPDSQAVENYLELEFNNHPEMQYVILMGSGIQNWNPQNEKCKIIVAMATSTVSSDDKFVDFDDDY
ncbi:MAG: hypothetical protein KAS62_04740, partial [Candidatus Delongbacteria bacterium]|nr:hypothetical protein [Candidatus Delongbacteria bacterium]